MRLAGGRGRGRIVFKRSLMILLHREGLESAGRGLFRGNCGGCVSRRLSVGALRRFGCESANHLSDPGEEQVGVVRKGGRRAVGRGAGAGGFSRSSFSLCSAMFLATARLLKHPSPNTVPTQLMRT